MARRDGARPAPHATGVAACAAAAASSVRRTRILFTSLEALGERKPRFKEASARIEFELRLLRAPKEASSAARELGCCRARGRGCCDL